MARDERALAGLAAYGTTYQEEDFDGTMLEGIGLSRDGLRSGSALTSVKFLSRYHAVARGSMAGVYGPVNLAAVETVGALRPDALWQEFERECDRRGYEYHRKMQPLPGLAALAEREGNLFRWVRDEVSDTGRLDTVYDELTGINGIGKKIASFVVRDAVWLWDLEDDVAPRDRHRVQAIDIWVGRAIGVIWPEYADTKPRAQFEEKARRVTDRCDEYGISGVEFNQGAYYFGSIELGGERDRFEETIRAWLDEESPPTNP